MNSLPIRCMNFYGLETDRESFVCDWIHEPKWYLYQLKRYMLINTIRLPFSYEYVTKSNMQRMDSFIDDCNDLGLDVILDYHRTWKSHQGYSPEEGITREQFITSWINLARRYYNKKNVIGIGVFNEYQGSNYSYLINIQNGVIDAIEKEMPRRYSYFLGCTNWGGNCSEMSLNNYNADTDKIFIEVHKYIFSGNSVESDWNLSVPDTIPPENWFIGEMGWKDDFPEQREWAEKFLVYLTKRNISNVCAWTIAHSGDTEGWWKDDCETFNWSKLALFNSLWTETLKRIRDL